MITAALLSSSDLVGSFGSRVGGSLLVATLKVTLLVMVLLAASPILNRTSASVRRLAWFGALLCALVALPAEFVLRGREVALPFPRWTTTVADGFLVPEYAAIIVPTSQAGGGPRPSSSSSHITEMVAPFLVLTWLCGIVICGWRQWRAERMIRRICGAGVRPSGSAWSAEARQVCLTLGLAHEPTLLISSDTDVPFVTGLRRATVVLPRVALGWDAERRTAIILHEFAHIAQRDLALRVIARVAHVVYWFNPIIWWVATREMVECERAADDLVLSAGVRPSSYASMLLDVAEQIVTGRESMHAMAFVRRSVLQERIIAVVSSAVQRHATTRPMTLGAILVSVLLGTALGCVGAARRAGGGSDSGFAGMYRSVVPAMVSRSEQAPTVGRGANSNVEATAFAPNGAQAAEPDIIGALIRVLNDTNSHVRAAAVRSLGTFTDARIEPALRKALSDRDEFVRLEVDKSLSRYSRQPRSSAGMLK